MIQIRRLAQSLRASQCCSIYRRLIQTLASPVKTRLEVVLIGDVRFVKRSRRFIAIRITGQEIYVSNKHLNQNERLDDFGSRTRPQFLFLTVIWIFLNETHAHNGEHVICDRQLITCKRYVFIDFSSSKLKKEPAFLDRLGDIVGEEIALFEPHVSKYFVRLRAMRRKSYEMHQ